MPYQNLEQRVSKTIKEPYKSRSEEIISEILEKYRINFEYEKQICVEERKEHDNEKARLWYPDFYLEDLGIIIEYVGRNNDLNYMKGVERKKEVYEKMGLKVIWVYGDYIFDNHKKRKDFEQNLMRTIYYTTNTGRSSRLRDGNLETNLVDDYNYKSKVA